MAKKQKQEKVIETTTIRLSADETRDIIAAAASAGKPVTGYRCCQLEKIGLMKAIKEPKPDQTKARADAWKGIETALRKRDHAAIDKLCSTLSSLDYDARKNNTSYVLTDLGKQVARGIAVRLNSQFKPVQC